MHTQAIEIFGNVLRRLVRWTSIEFDLRFYGDRPRGTPPLVVLNRRGVAKYSDFGPLRDYISETVQLDKLGLLLTTNRKSHMSFRLVSKSVILNDLEQRNNVWVISLNLVALGTDYFKVFGDTPYFLRQKCRPKNQAFSDIRRYWQGITPSESVKARQSENWIITWKRCKIGGKFLLISNTKSYMSFLLVPKSVTVSELERRNGGCHALRHRIG